MVEGILLLPPGFLHRTGDVGAVWVGHGGQETQVDDDRVPTMSSKLQKDIIFFDVVMQKVEVMNRHDAPDDIFNNGHHVPFWNMRLRVGFVGGVV